MKTRFKIKGMHCVSCGMNIDGSLEEVEGVKQASTSYAKSETEVEYDETKISASELKQIIKAAGYEADVIMEK